jgi:riboflavin kinase / FMN adenylyltransferase
MEIITSLDKINMDNCETGVALGNFDGVHIGHRTLIVNLVNYCREKNLKSVVYTFRNHPKKITSSKGIPGKIICDEQKFKLLRELGVDYTVLVEFDEYQRTLEPERFIKEILKDKLNMVYCVVGFNYHFGHKAAGNTELLEKLRNKLQYNLTVVNAIKIQDEVVSSTKIRQLIGKGDIAKANLFLGKNFSIRGVIVHGKGNGKKFGFPTANISLEKELILPNPGVYFTKCIVHNKIYHSVTNVGFNPTLGKNPLSVETHILDYDENIYGQEVEILFFQKSRNEMKHSGVDQLIERVNDDIQLTKKYFLL